MKTKVFVVLEYHASSDTSTVEGVFSTYDNARAFVASLDGEPVSNLHFGFEIQTFVIDHPEEM